MSAAGRVAVNPITTAIPSMTPKQFLAHHHASFGDPVDVLVANNPGDILISTDLHPAAFATASGRVSVPHMLLVNARGDAIALTSVNTGYSGGGPRDVKDFLGQLSWPQAQIQLVSTRRFLWLRRAGIVGESINSISNITGREIGIDADGDVIALVEPPAAGRTHPLNVLGSTSCDSAMDWVNDVLRADPPPPWADGEPVVRCYRTYEAVADAGLTNQRRSVGALGLVSVIIEQGQTQLWCSMPLPEEGKRGLPDATCDLLDALGLPADSLRASAPRSWWRELLGWLRELLAGNAVPAPYVDVSADGDRGLQRPPSR